MELESHQKKYIPGSDADSEDIFQYPFTVESNTINFIENHGRIMFIVRGPPGTGKNTLSKMLTDRYASAVICCADDYFNDQFSRPVRNKESLAASHMYCKKKVSDACKKNNHPIVVRNTHMRKFELQPYLDFAAEFDYTVIMAITTHKFKVSPEILAKSNTKGLTKDYFKNRLKQWEHVPPVVTGWFLCSDDSCFLLNELQLSLDALLGDGKFCRILNSYDKDELLKHYKAKKLLFCLAGCSANNNAKDLKSYYLSENVKDCYGRVYKLSIQAFMVMPAYALAIVSLNEAMKTLIHKAKDSIKKSKQNDIDDFSSALSSLSLKRKLAQCCKTIKFEEKLSVPSKTAEKQIVDGITINPCSFILLAESGEQSFNLWEIQKILECKLNKLDTHDGKINVSNFIELEKDFKMCRISSDSWLVKPPYDISLEAIFTGIYE
ncbi:2',3'-cyclic-nucleotide 3'-phosphodiesterase-like [Stegodyphus dumicola]|uniref:2',3'-cyclic-nucleotide 3'-phosphodiesterase-like n=1 Tax=Stegodyphus dumicola TaxID=202533 RepID=UPI0015A7FB5D|nr:2',3'-cyclic-nucleotide 3'-phosphodiesterase-like [Stegodyphus dumicola]XP_035218165.1 2',3'-cyclic-nucleotide 3'-phosphodiesterase-like [Stegodyphus dumicola]XP_035218166.1 2',3'-cyclic-nucleotide 3'-phosphodiesterase-like [Stegodyphus dumicola]XP_035218167.1 2',3'-cyclic-nucleotide 3'-phosphodiesterase-like [Stegodyphus dumicola]XP_035218169.1 2',3'-cyclic-nucleotide 3'-phosphodiesterase-like [Stegodyphus dumicola]